MTTVQLFGDIGLYSNYKQIINFTSVSAQNAWFNSKTKKTVTNVIYNKVYNSLKLNMSYGEAIQYSYVRLLDLDNTGRIYYNFVRAVNLIDDATVEFVLEPDVIQTYMTYWSLKESMINRAHVDRWSTSSDIPVRITPNIENPTKFMKVVQSNQLSGNTCTCLIAYTRDIKTVFTHPIIEIATFPVNLDGSPINAVVDDAGTITVSLFPTLSEVMNAEFSAMFNIAPEDIISACITPLWPYSLSTAQDAEGNIGNYYEYSGMSAPPTKLADDGTEGYIAGTAVTMVNNTKVRVAQVNNITKFTKTVSFINDDISTDNKPVKPIDNADASFKYEPALFIAPYQLYSIVDGIGNKVIDISPITIMENGFSVDLKCTNLVSSGGVNSLIWGGDDTLESCVEGSGSIYMAPSLDTINDKWLQYKLTQRDTDRQIVSNNNTSAMLTGAIFGSYGGALVSSRGQSGTDTGMGKLISKMVPGIALGGIASFGAAVIDSHYAWENQKAKEKGIQNDSSNLLQIGNASDIINTGYFGIFMQILRCDDVTWQTAYDNYRKYGYEIDQFTELDINSRKYYNYVMTNGAVIGGAIPENVRDIIASIFDSGVTIFHGDYCDTLTYPTKENIERSLMT